MAVAEAVAVAVAAVAVTTTGLHAHSQASAQTMLYIHWQAGTAMHTDPFSRSYKRTGRPT